MLKKPASFVLDSSKSSTYPRRGYASGFNSPAALPAEWRVLARQGWAGEKGDFFSFLPLIQLRFHLLLLNQASQICALKFEAVCGFCLITVRFLDGSLDDVAAMFFHRLMVRV